MCRNYDAGECQEPGCSGRITCNNFTDLRCTDHSVNGRLVWTEDDTSEDYAFLLANVRDAVGDDE